MGPLLLLGSKGFQLEVGNDVTLYFLLYYNIKHDLICAHRTSGCSLSRQTTPRASVIGFRPTLYFLLFLLPAFIYRRE